MIRREIFDLPCALKSLEWFENLILRVTHKRGHKQNRPYHGFCFVHHSVVALVFSCEQFLVSLFHGS